MEKSQLYQNFRQLSSLLGMGIYAGYIKLKQSVRQYNLDGNLETAENSSNTEQNQVKCIKNTMRQLVAVVTTHPSMNPYLEFSQKFQVKRTVKRRNTFLASKCLMNDL